MVLLLSYWSDRNATSHGSSSGPPLQPCQIANESVHYNLSYSISPSWSEFSDQAGEKSLEPGKCTWPSHLDLRCLKIW